LLTVGSVAATILLSAIAWATLAQASSVGGAISRAEAISRAIYWLNRGDTWYSQNQANAISDGTGGAYRPDCSGFVAMTWHLPKKTDGWDFNVRDYVNGPSPSAPGWAGVTRVSLDGLKAGDAIIKKDLSHIELFDRWVNASDHTQGIWTYGEHATGRMTEHDQMGWSYLTTNFDGYRYNLIVDGSGSNRAASPSDVSGDGRGDLLGVKPDGSLWYYVNNGGSAPFGNGAQIGAGFSVFSKLVASDVSGDGAADLLGVKPDGTLWYYPNNSSTNAGHAPFTTGTQIGAGFDTFVMVTSADVNGDGRADLLGVKPDGSLWYYANNGGSAPYGNGAQIGAGFTIFRQVMAADISGDGAADLIGVKPDGTLWYYPNGGGSAPYGNGTQIGSGFTIFSRLASMDISGDGAADLVGVKPDGSLWYYPNNMSTNAGHAPFTTGTQIGAGFNTFSTLL
jgi:hypothetical protein